MNADDVALFSAFDGNRTALRIDEGHGERLGWQVILSLDLAFEGVLGLGYDGVARSNGKHGIGIRAVNIAIGALNGFGEPVHRALISPRRSLSTHIGPGDPVHGSCVLFLRSWSSHI